MTDSELTELLRDLESNRVERKASLSDRERIREAICAFANDLPNHGKPGVIFVGVHDHGDCANLTISDPLLRTLADMRSDGNILPFPTMTVEKRTLGGCWAPSTAQRSSQRIMLSFRCPRICSRCKGCETWARLSGGGARNGGTGWIESQALTLNCPEARCNPRAMSCSGIRSGWTGRFMPTTSGSAGFPASIAKRS
ncbi:MAG: ATP-binding protein [Bryobacteraceae bacterium]|nr:ATP-binding protein [Bryobacteraceae bacterium]